MNTYLCLGRTGDICAILPFLKQELDKPRLVVSNQHSSLLEGVSYVEPVIWESGIHLLKEAYEWAKAKFKDVKSLQVIGAKDVVRDVTYKPAGRDNARATSFVKEMWSCAGKLDKWDEVWPLVFDRRNSEREAVLVEKYLPRKAGRPKKTMLVFTESHSSPFQYKPLLLQMLELQFSRSHNIIVNPQAERFFDLLALYEKADAIVSVDSAPLHLARAVPNVPVIALTNDQPILWNGSPWMPNHQWYCRYSDFPNRAVEMTRAIEMADYDCDTSSVVVVTISDSRLSNPWTLCVREGMTGRDSRDVGDSKRYPYLKDCIRMAIQKSKGSDHPVCITTEDNVFQPDSFTQMARTNPCFAYRMQDGQFHPVVDLFCATKSWWRERMSEIPDYIFGKDHYWRNGLWALFKKHHAADLTGISYRATPKT